MTFCCAKPIEPFNEVLTYNGKRHSQGEANSPSKRRKIQSDECFTKLFAIASTKDPNATYTILNEIGQGAFGKVCAAIDYDKREMVAVKQMKLSKSSNDKILNEVSVMKRLDHPNIVHFEEAYIVQDNLWVVMELMEGGSVADLIYSHSLKESQIAFICKEVLKGLSHLHENRIIHGDIKGENILLSMNGDVKIADFGFSDQLSPGQDFLVRTIIGLAQWMAPEVVRGLHYNFKADVWCVGTMTIEMSDCELPYSYDYPSMVFDHITFNGKTTVRKQENLLNPYDSFLSNCLQLDVEKRMSAKELLEHPFIKLTAKRFSFYDSGELTSKRPSVQSRMMWC